MRNTRVKTSTDVSYFDYESSKQDCLCHEAGHKAHHARPVNRIRRKAQRDRAGSRLRHPVCRGTKSMHLARSIGPILESCLLLTQATLSLGALLFVSFSLPPFLFFLPGPTEKNVLRWGINGRRSSRLKVTLCACCTALHKYNFFFPLINRIFA